jgi:ribosomal protein S18 acetylase RimI-like enzyme
MDNVCCKNICREIWRGSSLFPYLAVPIDTLCRCRDSLFPQLKNLVSSSHATPSELLPAAKSVIVYFVPFVKEIPKSNRKGELASPQWASAYVETNKLIIALNNHLADLLTERGYATRVLPPTHNFDTESLVSDWSHKHIAYIAGLGNFGYHHQLITEKGCCGRLGSLVTEAPLHASARPGYQFCLHKYDGSCRVCSDRCPVTAIQDGDFKRHDCYDLLLKNADRYQSLGLVDVCGKCSAVVPCSFLNPVKKQVRKHTIRELKLEEATAEDLPAVLALQLLSYQAEADRYHDPDLPPMKQSLADIRQEFENLTFLKATVRDQLVGSVRAGAKEGTCHIGKLIVHPHYQRLGIGQHLMLSIERIFDEAKRFELFTGDRSTPALNLYHALGFHEFSRQDLGSHSLIFLEKAGTK